MAARSPVADLCTEVLAGLDATDQRLTAATVADADPRPFGALVLDLVQPLRTSISQVGGNGCDAALSHQTGFHGLPPCIEREAIAILDSCERTLAAICLETEEDILNSASLSPSSRESATLHKLRDFNDRLKIILDLRSLYVLHTPNNHGLHPHANTISDHLLICWALIQMPGLGVILRFPSRPRRIFWLPLPGCVDYSPRGHLLQIGLPRTTRPFKAGKPSLLKRSRSLEAHSVTLGRQRSARPIRFLHQVLNESSSTIASSLVPGEEPLDSDHLLM